MLQVPKIEIPSLENVCKFAWHDLNKKILHYSQLFSRLLYKHLTTETEIHIKNGYVTKQSEVMLNSLACEKHMLDYNSRIIEIYKPWCFTLSGQPLQPAIENEILEIIPAIVRNFEEFIYSIQKFVLKIEFSKNNSMCRRLCSTTHSVKNFTNSEIPFQLVELLKHGINYVPTSEHNETELINLVEDDLKNAAISFFRANELYYPRIDTNLGLKGIVFQLVQQSQCNSKDVSFYLGLYESYISRISVFLNDLNLNHLEKYKNIKQFVPINSVLTISDKGLGPCLIPIELYIKQYSHQAEIGGHRATKMSEQYCLKTMLDNIQNFRVDLTEQERNIFKIIIKNVSPNTVLVVLKLYQKYIRLKVK